MKRNIIILLSVALSFQLSSLTAQTLPNGYHRKLQNASVLVNGDTLTVSTGKNERLYWDYYSNPGSRHDQSQDMLKITDIRTGKSCTKQVRRMVCWI